MKTYENARILVSLTDEQSAKYQDCRAEILSHAMSVIGNRSEAEILETEEISDDDATEATTEELIYQYLAEHCRYNLSETLMRLRGGHRMSEGMSADVSAAEAFAALELRNNPELLDIGRKILAAAAEREQKYRRSRANSEWNIEIIGPMPAQIGMCRYHEECQ